MSNLKPFDLEAVKAGKKFCHKDGMQVEDYEITKFGIAVKWDHCAYLYEPHEYGCLRMAPEEKEVWINVWYNQSIDKLYVVECYGALEMKEDILKHPHFTHLETIHRKYEI